MSVIPVTVLLFGETLREGSPVAILWSGPAIILASLMIAWGAEAAQFFIAQGIALAVLALLQTLPEFAVEAVLAWHRETPFLLANLTGALKLLTGLGWPMIYFAAARGYRRDHKEPMRVIRLDEEQAVQIFGLLAGIFYQVAIWWKGSLTIYDGLVLLAIYGGYLWIMRRLPPAEQEGIEEVTGIPRAIIGAAKPVRIMAILGLFVVGGVAVFLVADPFLAGLFGLATATGISSFVFISWVAPMISEAPEGISAYYWARDPKRASIALMNLVSSNINQWTLLAAMLPVVLSIAAGRVEAIPLNAMQSRELIMTLAQSLLGALFLINMELAWWEAVGLFVLWLAQFLLSLGDTGNLVHTVITWIYFGWCGVELIRLLSGNRKAVALRHFREILTAGR
jgi:cation:H+ antiporter